VDEHDSEAHQRTDHGHGGSADPSEGRLRVTTSATLHCLLGCGLGEVVGVVIGVAIGLSAVWTLVLAVVLGFVFGFRGASSRSCGRDSRGLGRSPKCSSPLGR